MRLSLKIALVLVAAFAAVAYANGQLRARERLEALEADAREDQALLASALAPSIGRTLRVEGLEGALYELEYAQQDHTRQRLRMVRLDGGDGPRPHLPPARIRLAEEGTVVSHVVRHKAGTRLLYTYARLRTGMEGGPVYALEASRPLPERSVIFASLLRQEAPWMALSVAVAAVLVLAIGGVLVGRPLNRLVEHTERVGAGDLEARVSLSQRDELGTLAKAMNRMSERLVRQQQETAKEHEARIQALTQLRHSERLATIGKLAAGLAHELGTPLNVIKGRAELISDDPTEIDDVRAHVKTIQRNVDRITKIVRALLQFSRADRNAETVRDVVDLSEVVQSSLELVQLGARREHVKLEVAEGVGVRAVGDADQLGHVVTNLIVNAIDASCDGDVVKVGVDHPAGEDRVCLWVEDAGCGIPEEAREHLFEPFFTTKGAHEGTGLGLAIVQGIVQDHQGSIEVSSEVGKGTRFTIWLPAARPQPASVGPRPPGEGPCDGRPRP